LITRIKWLRALILLTGLWMYALVTGLSPSVLRAATMFSFIIAGQALNRQAYIYNSIAASAFLLLLVQPAILFEVGFQLSYMAVIFIVFLHPYLYRLLSFRYKILNSAWSLTCVSLAAQAGTVPLSLFYFHQFPSYFILSNFVVIPAATVIIYGAALLFIASPIPVLLEIFGLLLNKFLQMVNFMIFFIEKMPGSLIANIRFAEWEAIFAYTIFATLSVWLL
jgi:competence protein ComEC